ncbi:major facilitator superfamily domain-containing protein [Podospora aff. communis PSN243]|uniref:Major facilitator superfamily domain-containing protein n=1 Tax=Podospora aff. communis PSN243 TaxID=3040156 RepID=A0AAV9GSM8_9PEZI|nr:major facilitator superfamily domain-containing protein [Podospora aff. communis PSN243]
MPPIVSLYGTFGSGSAARNNASRMQQLTAEQRLEEWKERDDGSDISKEDADVTAALIGSGGALGEPEARRRSWFSNDKGKENDLDGIATQRSVFDDPDLAGQYHPRSDWENIHRFDPDARWTWREEQALVRKIDWKIMLWTCIMFCALEMDRANIRQAVTDDLLPEMGLTTNDYNIGNSLFALSFLLAEVPSQLISKRLGPDRWIPIQMVLWSIVAASQFGMESRARYMVSRVLLGGLQGGFIPTVVLYLSYFYKAHELTIRMGFFWTAMVVADIFAAFSAFTLLHLRGVGGLSGWRWLFLIEGLVTLVFGLLSFGLMPAGPTQTSSWFRGKKGWFTPREEVIMVNRVIRDDPSKGDMHNREPLTFRLLFKSLLDYDLWPLYLIGLTNHIPFATPNIYLTLSLKGMGFTTFQTNLLVIPSQLLHIMNMLILVYLSQAINQMSMVAVISQFWAIPFLVWLRFVDTATVSKWTTWLVMTMFLGSPYAHPIQVGWVSRNSNTVRSRTVGSAMYNMCVQAGSIIASNIYREDDAPKYERGNSVLLATVAFNIILYFSTKAYYLYRNRQRDRVWDRMTESERFTYLATTKDAGNKRLDFRFAS